VEAGDLSHQPGGCYPSYFLSRALINPQIAALRLSKICTRFCQQ
jgi:hypothetical protein